LIPDQVRDRAGQPGEARDNRQTTPTSGPHLGGREHASAPFIELAADSVPAILNGFLVDHAIDVRLFA